MKITKSTLRKFIRESLEEKAGLWDNVHAKKERGEAPAKKGDDDYPDEKSWKAAQESDDLDEIAENMAMKSQMSTGGGSKLPKDDRGTLVRELETQLEKIKNSGGGSKNIAKEWLENFDKGEDFAKDKKFSLRTHPGQGGPTDEALMALQKELNPSAFGKLKKMFGFKEGKIRTTESRLRSQLRRIIRESIDGTAAGPNQGQTFLALTMSAIAADDYRKAANHIMDSFMIDDVFPEDEMALISALSALPTARRSPADIEAVADEWIEEYRAGSKSL